MAEITKKDLMDWKEETKRHSSILYEKFHRDLKTMTEGLATSLELNEVKKDLKEIRKKGNATFEIVGEMKKDIEIIKSDISFIKQELKHKVDRDEFEALEKRVIFLENKFKRI